MISSMNSPGKPYTQALLAGLLMIFLPFPGKGQVVTGWKSPENGEIIGNLDTDDTIRETDFAAGGIISDWSDILSDFEKKNTRTDTDVESIVEQIVRRGELLYREIRTSEGVTIRIPTIPDDDGVDWFLLTQDGIEIFLSLRPPAYLQDVIDPTLVRWIRYYAFEKKRWTQTIFRRYARWKDYFESELRRQGVPAELALLTLQESGCSEKALSPVGAAGVWQFMPETAQRFGLTVSWTQDDRLDTYKATGAAARLLAANNRRTGHWPLALAAYNCGADRVLRAAQTAGSTDWSAVSQNLPRETRNYVPGITALYYIWTYKKELGFE